MRGVLLRLLVVISFIIPRAVNAQTAASYNFSVLSSSFTSISSTGTMTMAISSGLDATQTGINIGFPFTFCGTSYTTLAAGNHGFLYLTNANVTPFTNTPASIPGAGFLMAFWDDIAGGGNPAYYETSGSAPNRVFTFQWTNWIPNPPPWTSGSGNATFQIKLYEGTNIIDFCYGPNSFSGLTATIGIANSTTDYKTVDAGGTTATGSSWTSSHSATPSSGTVYRWYLCPLSITASNDGPTCPGGTINLIGTTTGTTYTWSGPGGYSNTSLSPALTGVTAAMAGTYTFVATSGSCSVTATTTVGVIAPPTATITPASSATVCLGTGATFTASVGASSSSILSQNFNSGLGGWSITNIAGVPASYWQIRASPGYIGATPGDGTALMEAAPDATTSNTNTKVTTPSFSTVGYSSVQLAFNQYCYSVTGLDNTVRVEYSIDGGTSWATLLNQLGSTTGTTTWSAATPTTTVTLPSAALCQADVRIRWNYISTYGFYWAFDNVNITGTLSTTSYAWSGPAGGGLSCTTCASPTMTPTATGTYVYSLTSTVCGCGIPATVTVNVTPPPTVITGTMNTCIGTNTTLTNATSGGTWTSSNLSVATVGLSTGIVTGAGAGTATITYTMAPGCAAYATVTVYPMPGTITGTSVVCQGSSTSLSNSVSGGTWTSMSPGIASVGAITGVVTGVSPGTAVISYGFGGSCYVTQIVTVNPLPAAIVGTTFSLCVGQTTTYSDPTPGGIWQSSAPLVASVGITSGVVNGIGVGTATISYRVAGCSATAVVTVVGTPTVTATSVCIGQTTTMTGAPTGGTWTMACPAIATIGSSSGILSGVSAGTCIVTYAIGTGCTDTAIVTVKPLPAAIGGTLTVCPGTTATVTDATAGGTWSITSGSGTASIGSSTGIITGGTTPGTATVTYTIPTGCFSTAIVTINPLPSIIIGSYNMCQGTTTTFTDATPGGTWSSSNTGVATIGSSSGIAFGVGPITTTISYTLSSTGCYRTATVTVNPLPEVITGSLLVCPGLTTTLSDATPGGTWSIAPTTIATIDASGVVTGGSTAGTATVTYTAAGTGCIRTAVVTVNTPPVAISGPLAVCVGFCSTLTDATAGGTWTSSNAAVATIGASTGIYCGVTVGTSTITYTVTATGCYTTAVVSVNPGPGTISGTASVCVGQTTTLTSSTPGGSWSSSDLSVATVGSLTGIVTGVAPGTVTITTSLGTGCNSTIVVTVTPLPSVITGPTSVCAGFCATLADASPGGTWTISPASVATIVSGTGVYCGVTAGTATVTYTTGCPITTVITVNAQPAATTGTLAVCSGQTTTLSNATPGGTWSTISSIATVGSSTGIVTGGTVTVATTATITYTAPTGCIRTSTVTVNPLPSSITSSTGSLQVCAGSTIVLSGTPGGGTWSCACPAIASIGSSSGVLSGIATGTCTVTYTITSTGCYLTAVVTVNPLPAAITGTLVVCPGQTTTLSSATTGGIWSSGNLSVATVGTSSGIVTGGTTPGPVTITYTLPTGCRTTVVVTVTPLPGAITGTATVCVGQNTTLSSTTAGGTWTVGGGPGTASIGLTTGIVTGGTAGTVTVTYAIGTGCYVTRTVTVLANPAAIGGSLVVCSGLSTSLTNATPGGAWISSNISIATIHPTSGVALGVVAGTSTITYMMSSGCYATEILTVTTAPSAITGTLTVCEGLVTSLSSTPAGGTWTSSNPAVASVGTAGDVLGVSGVIVPNTATITYSLGTGCYQTATVTVNISPEPIVGSLGICVGTTTSLSDATPGGAWSSSSGAASVSTSGLVLGVSPGTSNISYSMASGCSRVVIVTVNSLPAAITGTMTVCQDLTTTLSSATPGGNWSASGAATVNPATGVVTGVTGPGTATIVYSLGTGCNTTAVVTVLALPAAIGGPLAVCSGLTATLTDATLGGTWSSSTSGVATIGSATGIVNAVSTTYGTTTITYKLTSTGCYNTAELTVNPLPAPITGVSGFCNLTTTTLSDATPGGTWSSVNPAIADFPSSLFGALTASGVDTVTVIYTLPTTCRTTKVINIILAPYPISGSPEVCEGSCTTLGNFITGGTWTSSDPSTAPISTPGGVTCGMSVGTAVISYELSNGCFSVQTETVNPTPGAITGTLQVCVGLTTTLSNGLTGGGWNSSNPLIADIDPSTGVITGIDDGTATITYSTASGCTATAEVTVNPLPEAITGTAQVCVGLCTSLSSATPGGAWSISDPFIGTVTSSGMACGNNSGNAIITYTLPTSCIATIDLTVNPLPSAITGTMVICEGNTSTLSNISSGGTWSSSDPLIATVDAAGVVYGANDGIVTITYTLLTGCIATAEFTVNPTPSAIGGSLNVCAGFMSNLTNTIPGGIWSMSGSTMVGTIHPLTGVVTGITPGNITVTYTLGTGCAASAVVTVIALPPAITGEAKVCEGAITILSDAVSGGTWTSSDAAIASVAPATGVVSGNSAGNATITYTVATGCINIRHVTVNPLPGLITGASQVCEHFTTTLSSTPVGQSWTSENTVIASIGLTSGVVTGLAYGTTNISYTIVATGCTRTKVMTVNPTPQPIIGSSYICISQVSSLSDTYPGGSWSSSNIPVATVGSSTGVATGISLGNSVITYQLPVTGCYVTKPVTVSPLPNVYNMDDSTHHYCAGGTGIYTQLNGSQIGVSYAIYYGASATGYLTGTGLPLNFGPLTVAGVYTVLATNATTGCKRNMNGYSTVVIDPLVTPTVTVTTPYGNDTVCSGGPRTFTAFTTTGGSGTPTYIWKVNGLTVGTGGTYTFIPATGDVVSVTMNSTLACASPAVVTGSMTVTVLPMVMPTVPILADPGDTVCQYTLTNYSVAPTYSGSAPTYTWKVNGAVEGTGPTFAYEPVHNDVVTVEMVSNYQCAISNTVTSTAVVMAVDSMTVPHVTISATPGLMVNPGQSVTLNTSVTNAGVSPTYQWKVNGVPVPGATNPSYTSTFNHYDSVTCAVTSDGWCKDITSFDWVFIAIAPLGVQQAGLGGDLMLLPNPNKGEFTIRGTLGSIADQELTAEVTNMLGQVVYRSKVMSKQGRVEAHMQLDNALANGMYILNLRSESSSKVFHFVMEQ